MNNENENQNQNKPEPKSKPKRGKSHKKPREGAIRPEIEAPLSGHVKEAIDLIETRTGMNYSAGKFLSKCVTEEKVREVTGNIIKAFDAF